MKKSNIIFLLAIVITLFSCEKGDLGESSPSTSGDEGVGGSAGVVTAAEWNDLDNWTFWSDLMQNQSFSNFPSYWSFYTEDRLSFIVSKSDGPFINAQLSLVKDENEVWKSRTDNQGRAELWPSLFYPQEQIDLNQYSLVVNGKLWNDSLVWMSEGVNRVNVDTITNLSNRVEISFIVDATGSMSDEIGFLRADLLDVISRVQEGNEELDIYTSSVFYRDVSDDYLTRKSDFSGNINTTLSFIEAQGAAGGGDFPEAVHSALIQALGLSWTEESKARIAFLLLDAPPHYEQNVIASIHNSIKEFNEMGIKLIPITASGIDKQTEFLMRFMAISTNGTYVFITNDSGVGGEHLEASVGEYQVEYLNDLMVRLISKYSE